MVALVFAPAWLFRTTEAAKVVQHSLPRRAIAEDDLVGGLELLRIVEELSCLRFRYLLRHSSIPSPNSQTFRSTNSLGSRSSQPTYNAVHRLPDRFRGAARVPG